MTNVLNSNFSTYVNYLATHLSGGQATFSSSVITYNIDGLLDNAGQYDAASKALRLWSAATGLSFVQVTGAASANIDFNNNGSDAAYTNWTTGHATVTVASDWMSSWPAAQQWSTGSYGLQTFIHEIGHALGLAHGGPYDGSGTYATDRIFDMDTWQYSVMSYFEQGNYTANHATTAFLSSPMLADIAAVEALYGALAVNTSNTIYGAGSTVMAGVTDFGRYASAAFSIHDTGGYDTFDLSNASASSYLDLRPGYYSNVNGLTGNVGIASDTIIEKAIGSSHSDTIIGNDVNNVLVGGSGNDSMQGYAGNDNLSGGLGNDVLYGGLGDDTLNGNAGADLMRGGAGNDSYYIDSALDTVDELSNGGSGIDTIYSTLAFSLGSTHVLGQVENITLLGTASLGVAGNSLSNVITGNAGSNMIYGFLGNDTLIGGGGKDYFVFNTRPNSVSNVDHIADFNPAADTIDLENAIYTAFHTVGAMISTAFTQNTTGQATHAADRIIYDTADGSLFYDADGTGATAAVKFASVNHGVALTYHDFLII